MCANKSSRDQGFTLVELLLGLSLAALLLGVLATALTSAQRIQGRAQGQMQVQRSGYVALERLSRQIALAGLNLDPHMGEEAFPPLPPEAGGNWAAALAMQYRPEGGSVQSFAYYVKDGGLVERRSDGQTLKVTAEGVRVAALSCTYFTYNNIHLDPASLATVQGRSMIQRVQVKLVLDRGSDAAVDASYELEMAVAVPNPHR